MAAKKTATKKATAKKPAAEFENRMVGGVMRKVKTATGEVIGDADNTQLIDGKHVIIPEGHVWDEQKGALLDPDGFVVQLED